MKKITAWNAQKLIEKIAKNYSKKSYSHAAMKYIFFQIKDKYDTYLSAIRGAIDPRYYYETLNRTEKHDLCSCILEQEDSALLTGNLSEYNWMKNWIKSRYLFCFGRAYKKEGIEWCRMIILCAAGVFFWKTINNPAIQISAAILWISVSIYFKFKKFTYSANYQNNLIIQQNDIIIRELRKDFITKNTQELEVLLSDVGWLSVLKEEKPILEKD